MLRKLMFYFCLCTSFQVSAQRVPSSALPSSFHQEAIAVHLNTQLLLAGETLLFKIYCFDPITKKPSELSAVAYVELIGEDQRPLAQMKVELIEGIGNGSYNFSGNTPSGNYTLIAYTKWMRNFGISSFYKQQIAVVNTGVKPPLSGNALAFSTEVNHAASPPFLNIQINKGKFLPREKISLKIINTDSGSCNLSVNVRRVEGRLKAPQLWDRSAVNYTGKTDSINFLPDFRGELIAGKITDEAGRPLANRIVSLSAPGDHFDFIAGTTDKAGRYFFSCDKITSPHVYITLLDGKEKFIVQQDPAFINDYSFFVPTKLAIDSSLYEIISKRLVSMQVENAFYAVKKDSVLTPDFKRSFFVPDKVYELDDFTRFPTMEDVFREIIPEAVVKLRSGQYSVVLTNSVNGFRFNSPPLFLLDGIPIQNVNFLMTYDPALIKSISLVTRHYFYGSLETDGILSIQTFTGSAKNVPLSDMVELNYKPLLSQTILYSPIYEGEHTLHRIPDFRTQLYWNPSVELQSNETKTLEFFTGDLPGRYSIEVTGLSRSGRPVFWLSELEVE